MRIGNVVGTGWKGKAVMKSLPLSVANPRTAGQVKQRSRFSTLVTLASILLAAVVKPLWDRFASGMSGYNAFISANQNAFNPDGSLNPYDLVISRGRMIAPANIALSGSGGTANITLTNPVGDRFALPTDNIYVVLLDETMQVPIFAGMTSATRGTGTTVTFTVDLKTGWEVSGIASYYAAYLRSDGSEVSNSFGAEA